MAKYVFLIAGNIGSGKTEFLNYIKKNTDKFDFLFSPDEEKKVVTIPEAIDSPALKSFYRDRKSYSFPFEISCLTNRIVRHIEAKHDSGIHIFDRGIIEGAETFSKNSYLSGNLIHPSYDLYKNVLKTGLDILDRTQSDSWLEKFIIYLNVDNPEILQQRQRKRNTTDEVIPEGYLTAINDQYTGFFTDIDNIYKEYGILNAPKVIEIDASADFNETPNYFPKKLEEALGKMKEMMKK